MGIPDEHCTAFRCCCNQSVALKITHRYADSSPTVWRVVLFKGLKCWVSYGLQIGLCQCLSVAVEDELIKGDGEVELNTYSHTIWYGGHPTGEGGGRLDCAGLLQTEKGR